MPKPEDRSLLTFEMDKDSYFKMLTVCLHRKETIDEFVTAALKDFLKRYKDNPEAVKALVKPQTRKRRG